MYNNKKILAIITARGGSKGLPKKNIRPLCGKPLIAWSIEQAQKSQYIDEIFISTDSLEIAEICKKHGIDVPNLRPAHLAEDGTSSVDVLKYTLEHLKSKGQEFDYFVLLQPTSPLRKDDDIDSIIKLALNNPLADGVITIATESHEHPLYAKRLDANGYMQPYIRHDKVIHQRQLLDRACYVYGSIYVVKVSSFFEHNAIYTDKILPFPLERWQCYEIDDIYDFICIEAVMKFQKQPK